MDKLSIPKKYLLVYAFDEAPGFYGDVRKIGEEKNLEVVVIAYKRKECMRGMKVYTNCGPADFVNLFSHADMVVTTSFHGTAFSIIMQKEFYCVPHPNYHERTDSLLDMFHLKDRDVCDFNDMKPKEKVNWNEVQQRLWEEREKSFEFLKTALQ